MNAASQRRVEIDALKAAGIVTIVLIHAIRTPWDPEVSTLEIWIGHATRFGVPAFLCASGYLYATREPVPLATTAARLRRILVPYLLASLLAQLFHAARGEAPITGSIGLDLLIGASFGPYYYVFVIAILVAATPLFARLSPRALSIATGLLLAAQWTVDVAPLGALPLTWHIRSPLLWWAYFLIGWTVRLRAAPLSAWVGRRRLPLAAGLLLAFAALTAASALGGRAPLLLVRSAAWLDVYVILAAIAVWARGVRGSPPWLRFLSDATYAVYLFHLFFLLPVHDRLPAPSHAAALVPIALPWLAGLLGSLLWVVAARALLGRGSRDWVGA